MNKVETIETSTLKKLLLTETLKKVENLEAELAVAGQQAQAYQSVATQAANRLLQIETSLSPQLLRKPNFWNIIFHFKEVIKIIQEVIKIIGEFKSQFIKNEEVGTNK